MGKERMSVHATRIAAGSASADPGHVHTAVSSTVASWPVFTRYRSSSVPGTQPTPACRLVVRGACKRLAYIFPGFVFPGPVGDHRSACHSLVGRCVKLDAQRNNVTLEFAVPKSCEFYESTDWTAVDCEVSATASHRGADRARPLRALRLPLAQDPRESASLPVARPGVARCHQAPRGTRLLVISWH
jgi:hypothetical protein